MFFVSPPFKIIGAPKLTTNNQALKLSDPAFYSSAHNLKGVDTYINESLLDRGDNNLI